MRVEQARRLKELEKENARLKKLVYHNLMGDADDTDTTTGIDGSSIVIHKH